jgi:hypothetical protein
MITVGINGHLMDAVFKARVLQGYPRSSVHLMVTPCCRPLPEFFRWIRSVATVEVDETSEYRAGHGEKTRWTYPPELDTTYPGYPSQWCVNYIASYCGVAAHSPGGLVRFIQVRFGRGPRRGFCHLR